MPGEELRPAQVTFNTEWRGSRPQNVECLDDVIAHVADMRHRAVRAAGHMQLAAFPISLLQQREAINRTWTNHLALRIAESVRQPRPSDNGDCTKLGQTMPSEIHNPVLSN
jgi:hypothetical protein